MPNYNFSGFDANGAAESGQLAAANEALAFETLRARGITVVSLAQGSGGSLDSKPWYLRDINFRGGRLSLNEQASVAKFLAILFGAKLPAREIIRISQISIGNQLVQSHFRRVGVRVEDGETLADAFEAENTLFSPIFVTFLKTSGATNATDILLRELAEYFEGMAQMRQKIISAIIYPAILVLASFLLVFVVVFYLAPTLEPIFQSVGKDVPPTLARLLAFGDALQMWWPFLLGTGVGFIVIGSVLSKKLWAKRMIARTVLALPIAGDISKLSTLARLSKSTELLLKAGVPFSKCLKQAAEIEAGASPLPDGFLLASDYVNEGQNASRAFQESNYFPREFVELFLVGEKTNTLPESLKAMSEILRYQVDQASSRALSLLTPVLTLILGGAVATLVLTLMSAILEVNQIAF
jgi:general secretion pathway protein F